MAISDRIQSIEEHIKESYQELEGLGIDTTGVNKNLENIPKLIDGYWETLPKVTGEGTSITLDNTKEGKMKIVLKGNTSQEGTPTPETPQDIHVVSGDNSINVCGKNLLDTSILVEANADKTYTNSGFWGYKLSDELTTFTLSRENNTMYANAGYLTIGQGNTIDEAFNSKLWLMHPSVQSLNAKSKTLTNTGELWLFVGNTQEKINTTLEYAGYFQLEKGSTATTYQAYKGASYPINLGDIELCKIGDYQDSIVKDNGKWYLNKQIGKVVLDGSEEWIVGSTGTANWFYQVQTTLENKSNGSELSNYYKYTGGIGGTTTNNGVFVTGNGLVRIRYGSEDTIANYKNWLSTHNLEVYCVSTPTTTEITDSTLLSQLNALAKSYASQTNISQESNDLASLLNATALSE